MDSSRTATAGIPIERTSGRRPAEVRLVPGPVIGVLTPTKRSSDGASASPTDDRRHRDVQ